MDVTTIVSENVQKSLDAPLGETGFSLCWVLQHLATYDSDFCEARQGRVVTSVTASRSASPGFSSHIFFVSVEFGEGPSYRMVMKVPTTEIVAAALSHMDMDPADYQQCMENVTLFHNIECDVLPIAQAAPGVPTPILHFAQRVAPGSHGVLMMSAVEGRSVDLQDSLTMGQCEGIATILAHLHHYILGIDRTEWRSRAVGAYHTMDPTRAMARDHIRQLTALFPDLLDDCNLLLEVEGPAFARYVLHERAEQRNATNLVHGDLKPDNVLFGVDAEAGTTDQVKALLDFQLATAGNPLFDLARLFCFGLEPERRRQGTAPLLDAYYNTMLELCHGRVPFSRPDCTELFELAFAHQAFQMIGLYRFLAQARPPPTSAGQPSPLALRTCHAVRDGALVVRRYGLRQKFGTPLQM